MPAPRSALIALSFVFATLSAAPAFAAKCGGDFNGFIQGCIGTEIAVRNLHNEPTPKEVMLKPIVIDKSNSAPYEVPVEKRTCPTLQSLAAK